MAEAKLKKLPAILEIEAGGIPVHTPRETALLKAMSGKDFTELVGEGAEQSDRERALAWFTLRRLGFEPTWEDTEDVLIDFKMPNPQNGDGPRSSPPSVASGG